MDASKVKKIVEKNIVPMMESVGIPHWRITVEYDQLEEHQAATVSLKDADYWRAHITVDPAKCGDEEELLRFLRHELLHILAAPFVLYRNVVTAGGLDGDSEARLYAHAMEQFVLLLEKGLAREIAVPKRGRTRKGRKGK